MVQCSHFDVRSGTMQDIQETQRVEDEEEMTCENFDRIATLCAARFHELYDDLVKDLVKYMEDEVSKIKDDVERESVRQLMNEELSDLID